MPENRVKGAGKIDISKRYKSEKNGYVFF